MPAFSSSSQERTPSASNGSPEEEYREREARFRRRRDRSAARADRIANARLFVFTLAVILGFLAAAGAGVEAAAFGLLAGASVLGFAILVVVHGRASRQVRWWEELRRGSEASLARRRRAWDELEVPSPSEAFATPDHPYAADLNVEGAGSLLQLAGATGTGPGLDTLATWFLTAAKPAEVARRQAAVAELAPRLDWRERFRAEGRLSAGPSGGAMARFLGWAESGPWLATRPWLRAAAWGIPAATLLLAGLQLAGLTGRAWWLLSLGAAIAVTAATRSRVHGIFDRAGGGEEGAGAYAPLLERLAEPEPEFRSPALEEMRRRLARGTGKEPARASLEELRRLGALADTRFSMLHFLLQWGFLWDLHVLAALERWQRGAGGRVRGWLDDLGEADALAALGTLAHGHPDWCFPEVVDGPAGERTLTAEELGHPLLAPGECVRNDVEVGPPGSFLLVTGSNMSGKSTLLRAMGANTVLALAGAPACARRLRLPPVDVWTSMRVEDSLREGVSQFMAELRRLKAVVEAAREAPRGVLYLLDETLRGTNEAERRIAGRRVLRLLLDAGAIGAVSTHDIELADVEPLASAARRVHFSHRLPEGEGELVLLFDHRLRSGLARATNALALMDRMGLRDPEGSG